MTTHTCQFCDSDYACATFVQGEDEHGRERSACECKATDECPGCSEHGACEDCGKAPAGDEREPFLCTPCADVKIDNYSGPEEADYGGGAAEQIADGYRVMQERRR